MFNFTEFEVDDEMPDDEEIEERFAVLLVSGKFFLRTTINTTTFLQQFNLKIMYFNTYFHINSGKNGFATCSVCRTFQKPKISQVEDDQSKSKKII